MWYFLKGRRSTKNAFKTINTRKFFFFISLCMTAAQVHEIQEYLII